MDSASPTNIACVDLVMRCSLITILTPALAFPTTISVVTDGLPLQ